MEVDKLNLKNVALRKQIHEQNLLINQLKNIYSSPIRSTRKQRRQTVDNKSQITQNKNEDITRHSTTITLQQKKKILTNTPSRIKDINKQDRCLNLVDLSDSETGRMHIIGRKQ